MIHRLALLALVAGCRPSADPPEARAGAAADPLSADSLAGTFEGCGIL